MIIMKHAKLMLLGLSVTLGTGGPVWAQYYDDIYYDGSQEELVEERTVTTTVETTCGDNVSEAAYDLPYFVEERDVDEYNRRYTTYDYGYEAGYYDAADTVTTDEGEDFEYTERIRRFHNPTVIIESEDEDAVDLYIYTRPDVNVVVASPYYYSSWWGYDPWLWNTWYYDPYYYSPWYYGYWYASWPYWGWNWGWGWTWSLGHHHHPHWAGNLAYRGGHYNGAGGRFGGRGTSGRANYASRGAAAGNSHRQSATSRYSQSRGGRTGELVSRSSSYSGGSYSGSRASSGSRVSSSGSATRSSSVGTRSSSSAGGRSSGGFSGGGSRGGGFSGGGSHGGGGGGGRR